MADKFKSGFVTLVGRPNAGKSTLIDAVVGHKGRHHVEYCADDAPSLPSHRHARRHANDHGRYPGLHKPHDALGEELNTSAIMAMEDVDVIAFLIDASKPIGRGDEWVAAQVRAVRRTRKILVITKADLVGKDEIIAQLEAARALGRWDDEVVPFFEIGLQC